MEAAGSVLASTGQGTLASATLASLARALHCSGAIAEVTMLSQVARGDGALAVPGGTLAASGGALVASGALRWSFAVGAWRYFGGGAVQRWLVLALRQVGLELCGCVQTLC